MGFHRNAKHWVTFVAGRSPGHLSRLFPAESHPPRARVSGAGEPLLALPATPGAGPTEEHDVTVESTAARKPRRSAGGKADAGGHRAHTRHQPPEEAPELVQLLTPEGKRVEHPEYQVGPHPRRAARPVPRHGAHPPLRRRGHRPAAPGRTRPVGLAARSGGRADRLRPGHCATTTTSSRPTASTVSPGAGASTRRTCSGMFRGVNHGGWDPTRTTSTCTRSSSARRRCTPRLRDGHAKDGADSRGHRLLR